MSDIKNRPEKVEAPYQKKYLRAVAQSLFLLAVLCCTVAGASAEERFPRPEFESEYIQKTSEHPPPQSLWIEYADMAALFAALSAASWLALKKRSRKGMIILTALSLLYFGFIRKGCVCSVGALQNVSLALIDDTYTIPVTVAAFFLLPLVFALFFGRVFCSGVCPLGAIQDLVILKPVKLPRSARSALTFIPRILLVFGVLLAATGTGFMICRHDPFVCIFRMSASGDSMIAAAIILLLGIFIARPYCSFICPYGVLLSLCSRLSAKHMSIAPEKCVRCRLCEDSCPFDAIREPHPGVPEENETTGRRRLLIILMATPVLMVTLGWTIASLNVPLSRLDEKVKIAERIALEDGGTFEKYTVDTRAVRRSDIRRDTLVRQALEKRNRLRIGGWIAGGVLGLLLAGRLLASSVWRRREEFEPDHGDCLSCLRCVEYCPEEIDRRKKLNRNQTKNA